MGSTSEKISVHHVGGRSGSRPFPYLPEFAPDVIGVLYDADADCIEQIEKRVGTWEEECRTYPYFLGGETGTAPFHINFDPCSSSALSFDEAYGGFSMFYGDHDYPLGEAFAVGETRELPLWTLDDLYSRGRIDAPPPDVLSLDTQGSELAIVEGGKGVISAHTLAIVTEVEFNSVYRDQPLFGDLVRRFDEMGFEFVRFTTLGDASPARMPIGARSAGYHLWGDALFLRRGNALPTCNTPEDEAKLLYKFAYIALALGQLERALMLLDQAATLPDPWLVGGCPARYPAMLRQLRAARDRLIAFPPTFRERLGSFEASRERFAVESKVQESLRFRLRIGLQKWPRLLRLLRRLRVRAHGWTHPLSPVETVLNDFGFDHLVMDVRQRRLVQQRQSRSLG